MWCEHETLRTAGVGVFRVCEMSARVAPDLGTTPGASGAAHKGEFVDMDLLEEAEAAIRETPSGGTAASGQGTAGRGGGAVAGGSHAASVEVSGAGATSNGAYSMPED